MRRFLSDQTQKFCKSKDFYSEFPNDMLLGGGAF